ncbi:MAG TPA: hypothetical protein VF297_04570 [Pyrinomonadaceae bacterium]
MKVYSSDPAPGATRDGRLLLSALVFLGALALSFMAATEARAQEAPSADLTITKSADETAPVGGTITYSLVASNGGPDTSVNVVLTDTIPAHTTFVSADISSGDGSVSFDGTTLTVTFTSIAAFESGSATLVVRVNEDTPRGTIISNTVTGTSSTTDPQTFDNSATAETAVIGPFPGDLLITEFRLRGPGGANDEYIEVYNNGDAPRLISTSDESSGYAIAASDGVIRCIIPNGTVIPARGHFLCVNEVAYSLGLYPAGDGQVPTATGDATFTTDIPDNAGIALFRTTNTQNFNVNFRLDAVGSTAETNALYKEGTGYAVLSPLNVDHAFYRDNCGKSGSISTFGPCTTAGAPRDTDNNVADFIFVDTNGSSVGAGQRLGAPGPENFSSPVQSNNSFDVALLDPCVGSASPPNRVRSFTSDPANNSTFGTLEIRRTVTNGTGLNVTRLRWRIIDLTTFPAPSGIADLRARTSTPVVVTVDRAPCGSGTSSVTVQGTTLEQPPSQPNGGGFNSSLSSGTVTLATPLADGESIDVRFLLGIQQTGSFKFFINVETLTREPEIVPEETLGVTPRPPLGPSVRPRKGVTATPSTAVRSVTAPPAKNLSATPAKKVSRGARKVGINPK